MRTSDRGPRVGRSLAALCLAAALAALLPIYSQAQTCDSTYDVGAAETYTTIQAAVDAVPSPLVNNACVVVKDGPYTEQVTVVNKINNGFRLTIKKHASLGSANVVLFTSNESTAAFHVANASVTIQGFSVAASGFTPYAVLASSPYVTISNAFISDTPIFTNITVAGISISSWSTISYSTINVQDADAIRLPGSFGTVIVQSSATANAASRYALHLLGASGNTINDSYLSNNPGTVIMLRSGSNSNVISDSTSTEVGTAATGALFISNSNSNTVTRSRFHQGNGWAVYLESSDNNLLVLSTFTSANLIGAAGVFINGSSSNTILNSYISNPEGTGLAAFNNANNNYVFGSTVSAGTAVIASAHFSSGASSNTFSGGTVFNPTGPGLSIESGADRNTITRSFITAASSHAVVLGDSTSRTTISLSTVASLGGSVSSALRIAGASSNTVVDSYIFSAIQGIAISSAAHHNSVSRSTVVAGAVGIHLTDDAAANSIERSVIRCTIPTCFGVVAETSGGGNVLRQNAVSAEPAGGGAVYVSNSDRAEILGNTLLGIAFGLSTFNATRAHISSNTIIVPPSASLSSYGILVSGGSGHTVWNNSIVYRTSGSMGLGTTYGLYLALANDVRVHHNRITNPGMITGGSAVSVHLDNADNVDFKFNDVHAVGTSLTDAALIQLTAGSSGARIKNNVFYSSFVVTGTSATLYVDAGSLAGLDADYNAYFSANGQPYFGTQGTNYGNRADWTLGSGQDSHSITADPLWNDLSPGVEDFHPKSSAGRFDPATSNFVQDLVQSATIDAADPAEAFDLEPSPTGGRANLGSYGKTSQASLSSVQTLMTAQSGPWSLGSTWVGGSVPTAVTPAVIQAGHLVTVDITTAAASTTTVHGTLEFSTTKDSQLSLNEGSLLVKPGGTLRMGQESAPIPANFSARLVLAQGDVPSHYGLLVEAGGNFSVRGATKTPVLLVDPADDLTPFENLILLAGNPAAAGWKVGDTVTLSPSQGYGASAIERRTITFMAANSLTVDSAFSSVHYGTESIRVANLTRNVLVRSSGTDINAGTGNSAYVHAFAADAASFNLAYGEFAYIGASGASGVRGVTVQGAATDVSIDSCVFRQSFNGLSAHAGSAVLRGNLAYGNLYDGIWGGGGTLVYAEGNDAYGNGSSGLLLSGNRSSAIRNAVYGNQYGVATTLLTETLVYGNRAYSNGFFGIYVDDTFQNTIVADNDAYRNAQSGLVLNDSRAVTTIGNRLYSNTVYGLAVALDSDDGLLSASDSLGFDSSGASRPNGSAELSFGAGDEQNLVMKEARMNPAYGGISTAAISAGSPLEFLLSYNQNGEAGSLRLWGRYTVAASTLTLDYAQPLYRSTATVPVLAYGSGHSASVTSTDDDNAVSQLIRIRYDAPSSQWRVEGSSSGLLGSFSGAIVDQPFPAGTPQFRLTFTPGPSPRDPDFVRFGLIAGSRDANRQKKLLFGSSTKAESFMTGLDPRSRLEVSASGGLVLRGVAGAPTLVDRIDAGSTYYTLIDSGAFTAENASLANMDLNGVQLFGTAGVALSSASFDYLGVAAGENAYLTLGSLTSAATLDSVAFHGSRLLPGTTTYNVRVTGTDSGLDWLFTTPTGTVWGENFDFDPNGRVAWTSLAPNLSGYSVFFSSIVAALGAMSPAPSGYEMDVSTASDFSGAVSSAGAPGSATSIAVTGLAQSTTYYFRVGSLSAGGTNYLTTVTTVTLAASPAPLSFTGITGAQFTVNWSTNGNPAGTRYAVEVSTSIHFGLLTSSLSSTGTNATFAPLAQNTTFFVRVTAFNLSGTPSEPARGAVITAPGVITISANRLAGVWYNFTNAIFNAQGAVTYHYSLSAGPSDIPALTDPVFDGSALTVTLPQSAVYFHVLGLDGSNNAVGSAHFGPLQSDEGTPVITSLAATKSSTDPTPIPDGGTTLTNIPHFAWSAASTSPVVGYSYSVSLDPAQQPVQTVNTTLSFVDASLSGSGLYYFKVRALNIAGTWGPAMGLSLNFVDTPTFNNITLKSNYFNPLRGECARMEIQTSSAGKVRIELYSLLGHRVASVADEETGIGTRNYAWCGRNESGELVATGGYYLRIVTPQQKKTMKIAVVK